MGGAGLAAPAWIWSLISPVTFFLGAMWHFPLFVCRAARCHELAWCQQWWDVVGEKPTARV
jgi:hypothetical protein